MTYFRFIAFAQSFSTMMIKQSFFFLSFPSLLYWKSINFFLRIFLARERFQSEDEESLGSEQEAEAERELQQHTTMGTI